MIEADGWRALQMAQKMDGLFFQKTHSLRESDPYGATKEKNHTHTSSSIHPTSSTILSKQ